MTLNKKRCLIFLAVILILLLGVTMTTAATVQKDNNTQAIKDNGKLSTPVNNDVDKVVQSSASITGKDAKVKNKNITTQTTNTENKEITKKTVTNTKQATGSVTVSNYEELKNHLTSNTYSDLTITLDGENDYISTGRISVNSAIKNLTIIGNDKTIDGQRTASFLDIDTINLTINNIIVKNCRNDSDGGVIFARDSVITLNNSLFENNEVYFYCSGGVIYMSQLSYSSSLTTNNCTFTNNIADYGGGAISITQGDVFINNSTFIENKVSDQQGGAIYSESADIYINNSTFKQNIVEDSDGGAIYSKEGNVYINDSMFEENHAYYSGGALYSKEYVSINNSTFKNNGAEESAGAIYSQGGDVFIDDSNFVENIASEYGGAIYVENNLEVNRCNFTKNNAGYHGGAIYYLLNLTVDDCNFTENHAVYDGGAIADAERRSSPDLIGYTIINNSRFVKNTADRDGGAFIDRAKKEEDYTVGNHVLIKNSEFSENVAVRNGGVIFIRTDLETQIENTTFTSNNATNGGVVYSNGTDLVTITSSNFTSNNATNGGVVYSNGNGPLTITSSNFISNRATNGGVVYSNGTGLVTIASSNATINTAALGGVVYQGVQNEIKLLNSNFTNNNASGNGGVVYSEVENSNLFLEGSIFENNAAKFSDGGVVYQIAENGNLTIVNSNFTDNKALQHGGAIYQNSNSNITITNSIFKNNQAKESNQVNSGGAIYQFSDCMIIISDSEFKENVAGSEGGAIYQDIRGNLTVSNSNFTDNQAVTGGAICQYGMSNLTIKENSLFKSNIVTVYSGLASNIGASIYQKSDCTLIIDTSEFTQHTCNKSVIYQEDRGNITVSNSNFTDNQALRGSVLHQLNQGNITIYSSNFTNNRAINEAGVINQEDYANLTIYDSNFINNQAGIRGGAIVQIYSSAMFINNTNFTNNNVTMSTSSGGAISQHENGKITINNSNFRKNSAQSSGGSIYQYNQGSIFIECSNFTSNTAGSGGAIWNKDAKSLLINDSYFDNNNASSDGGALYVTNNNILNRCNFTNNRATRRGGAIYTWNLDANNCNFTENRAVSGAAIKVPTNYGANIKINNSNFNKNYASDRGAFLHIDDSEYTRTSKVLVDYSNFTENVGSSGAVIYFNELGNLNITNSNFNNNIATSDSIIYSVANNLSIISSNFTKNNAKNYGAVLRYSASQGFAILENNTFDSNWVNHTSKNYYVFELHKNMKIVNNTFINNTDNTRDMLFNILVEEIHDNKYINNYLNDTMDVLDMTVSEDFSKDINIDLRNVYNDTIRNGKLKVFISGIEGEYASIDVENGIATLNIPYTDLPANENTVTLNYITLDKHYQNITQAFKLNKAMTKSNLTVSANETVKVGQAVRINGTLTQDDEYKTPVVDATIYLYINGTLQGTTQTNNYGEYEFNYVTPNIDLQQVTVNFTGKDVIEFSSNTTSFTVSPRNTNMTIKNNETLFTRQNITVSGVLYDELGDKVSNTQVEIWIMSDAMGQLMYAPVDDDGNYSITFPIAYPGTSVIKVVYKNHTTNYTSSTNTSSVTVNARNTNMTIVNNDTILVGQKVTINGTLLDELNEPLPFALLNITVGEHKIENVYVEEDGTYLIEYQLDQVGTYEITVTYVNTSTSYIGSINTSSVTVNARNTNMTVVNNADVFAGQNVTINGVLRDELGDIIPDTLVNITIGSFPKQEVQVNSEGVYSLNYTIDEAGTFEIIVEYNSHNSNYTSSINTSSVIVNPRSTNMTIVNEPTIISNTTLSITGVLTDELGEIIPNTHVNVKIGTHEINVEVDNNGVYTTNYLIESADEYIITVEYINETTKYLSSTNTSSVSVTKRPTITNITVLNSKYGNVTIKVNVTDIYADELVKTGIFAVYDSFGNKLNIINISESGNDVIVNLSNSISKAEPIQISVGYDPNDIYIGSYAINETSTNPSTTYLFQINVEKLDSEITVKVNTTNTTIGENVTINGTLTDGSGNNITDADVTVCVDGQNITVKTDDNGQYTLNYTTVKTGNITVTASFDGGDNYNPSISETSFNVTLIPTITKAEFVNSTIGNVIINVNVTNSSDNPVGKGHVKVYDNETGVLLGEGDLVNGGVNITLSVTSPGHLGVNVTYEINDVYNSSNAVGNINPETNITETDVVQLSSTVVINVVPSDLIIGEAVQISGNVFDSNGRVISEGKVNVTINGTNTTVDVKDGYYNLTYVPGIAGAYPVNATFLGNSNVSGSISENKGFTVNKMQTITSISVLNNTYGNVMVEVRVTNSTGAPVTTGFVDVVYENGTLIKRVNLEEEGVAGVVNVSIATTSLDDIFVNASYVDNRLYSASVARGNPQAPGKENTTLITVEALTPIIVIDLDKDNVTIGDTVTINGTAIDNMGNPLPSGTIINISIGNSIEKVSVEGDEGKFTLAYITSSEGTFIVNATHDNVISNNLEFTVNKIATITNVTIINTTVGNVTLNISVAGKDNKVITEGKVNITIAGDSPIVVDLTGENTIVELLNNITTTGLFYVNVEYTGNDTYLPSTALDTATGKELKNITVTARNTSITVNTDILISDIGQDVTINGTLVDEMNNPIANATIIISIGGTNYTAKTGEDGKYALDYVASILGNNSVVAVFEGNENYNPSNNETSFNVTKISTITTIESVLSNKVGNVTLAVNVTNATGELVGTGYVEVIDAETGKLLGEGILKGDGKVNITLTGVTEPGFIKVNVTYVENDHYYPSCAPGNTSGEENTTTMRVYGSPSIIIKLSENNVTIGDKVTVQVNVTDDLGEQITEGITVNVSINGTDYNAVYNDATGYHEVEYQTTTVGEFPVNATFVEGGITSDTLTFTVNKIPTKTEVQIMNNTAGNVTINVAITNATDNPVTTGFFNVTVAGKTTTVEVKGINTTVSLDVASAGDVSVSVKYLEGDVYAESIGINNETQEELTNITVVKQKTGLTLNINPNDTFIGKTVTISGVLVDGFDNPVSNALITIKVNSTEYLTKTGSDGSYSIDNVTIANGTIPVEVFYDGNETLDKVNTTGSFKVNKIPTVTLVSVVNDTAANVSIAVKVIDADNNPVRSGQFTVTYEGATTSVPVSGDVTNIPLKLYTNGTFILKVEYSENDVYINSTGLNETLYPGSTEKVKNITVNKQNTTLSVEVITPVKAGNKTVISGILLDEQGKAIPDVTIHVRVGDEDVGSTFTGSDGSYTFEFDETVVGTHTVTGNYAGNGTYNQSSNTATLVVDYTNTSISINPLEDVTIGNIVNITGKLVDEFNNPLGGATVKVTFDTDSRDVTTDTDGTFNASFTASSVGNKTVKVEFAGNNTHTASNDTSEARIVPVVATITSILPGDAKVGDTTSINGTVTDKNGNPLKDVPVNVTVNGKIYPTKTDENGKYNVSVNNTVNGLNNVTVSTGNENVTAENLTDKFIADKKTTNITINQISDVPVGKNVTINGTLTDEDGNKVANATIRVKVGDEEKTVRTDKDGKYNVSFSADEGGPNLVNVYYDGNDTFEGTQESGMFEVTKKSGNVTANIPANAHVGDTINVTGTLKDENGKALAGEPVEVKVNGKTYTTPTDGNGNYKVPVNNLEEGTNYISVTVPSSKVNVQPVEKNLTVTKKNTNITIQNLKDVPIGTTVTITGTLTDENKNKIANATVRVKVGNEEKTVRTDKDGKYNASFAADEVGPKLVNVYYDGNDTFDGSQESGMFEVTKKSGSVTANIPANAHVGDTINVTGTLKDEDGKPLAGEPVEVKVNGKTYKTTTDKNGNYAVPVNNLEDGTNYISVTVPSSKVSAPPVEKSFTITKKNTRITVQNIPDVSMGTTVAITGTLTDETGKVVPNADISVTVNGITETVKSDNNGKYTLNYPTTTVKQENVAIMYAGNQTLNGSRNSTRFNVVKANATLTVNKVNATSLNDNITVTGRLVDKNNKPIANAPVTITVNGENKTVTTDAQGNYKLPVENAVNGKNNVTVKYESDKYNAVTKSTDFTLRKLKTIVTVESVIGTIGEDITLVAHVTDENGNNVSGGNLVFKLNGRTLREDGRFDTDTGNPLKLKVKDGLVTFTMKADLYLRKGKNITASYSGSIKYEEAKGNVAIANIRKRTSQVTVTVTPKMAKQNTDVIFTATLTDITKNAKNTTCLTTNATIMFKVNGNTLKDKNGKIIRLPVTRDVVNYAYHIDRGTAGIDNNKNLRNYTVEAVYDNELFYPDARNTTVYNVERSSVNIKFTKTSVQNNMLSVKATIKDYEGINVVGNTKICIKINGVTYTENGQPKYFTIKNGNVDLSGIKLSTGTTVKSVMIVAGETSAYLTARESTTEITTT